MAAAEIGNDEARLYHEFARVAILKVGGLKTILPNMQLAAEDRAVVLKTIALIENEEAVRWRP